MTPTTPILQWAKRLRWLGAVGAGLALLRYGLQAAGVGSANIYTDTARQFYLVDDVLGWKTTEDSWVWLGLDAVGPIVLAAIAGFVLVSVAHRFADRKPGVTRGAALGAMALAVTLPWIPLWAIGSGLPPDGASMVLPEADDGADAIDGVFTSGAAGTYVVVENDANAVIATIGAGGESFDVSFGQPSGSMEFDPQRLGPEVTANFAASVANLDAGIPLRSSHARDYLNAEEYETLTVSVTGVTDHRVSESGDTVFYSAQATITVMGTDVETKVEGKLLQADAAAREQIGVDGEHIYVLHATLTLNLNDTPLKASIDAFDESLVPITIRMVLKKEINT